MEQFWHNGLTAAERTAMRRFLASEEYDTTQHELVVNEMQAYLMFTRNKEFFRASDVGLRRPSGGASSTGFLPECRRAGCGSG